MPDSTVKIKNISGEDRIVPSLGRLVMDGQEVEIPATEAPGFSCQPEIWQTPLDSAPGGDPSSSWTIPALKAFAAEHEIDLGDASKKSQILAAIQAADTTSNDDAGDGTED